MILIDQSAGSKELVLYPPLNDTSLACLTSLAVSDDTRSSADVCFTGNGPDDKKLLVGIEFKKLSDLLSSIHSGRLGATQAQTMTREYQVCWILYCGEYRCGEDGMLETPWTNPHNGRSSWRRVTFIGNKPMPYGYLESSLLTYSAVGIQSKHVSSIEQAAQWIACLHRWWSKPWDKHRSLRTFDRSSDSKSPALMPSLDAAMKAKILMAKEFPGMGYERAIAAAKYFHSVRDMINASVEEWLEVPGVGKVIAKQIVEWVSRSSGGKVQASASNLDVFDS